MLTEFKLIERYFQTSEFQTDPHQWTMTTNGDDCALLRVPTDKDLVCSVDTLVAGVHFPEASSAFDIGYRALATAVSDLAAMGATPAGFYLALTLPNNQESWISGFADGLLTASKAFSIPLLGGDTTKGPLNIGIQVQGLVPKGQALLRCGAKPGDRIYISGYLGEAAAALASVLDDPKPNSPLKHRFFRPEPRITLGERLRGLASACIDVSDGLVQDLAHLCQQSGTRAMLKIDQLPLSEALTAAFDLEQCQRFMLSGGDDYELCFTVPSERADEVEKLLDELSLPGAAIGTMLEEPQSETVAPVTLLDPQGNALPASDYAGFQHF